MNYGLVEGQWGMVSGADPAVLRVPIRAVYQQHGNHLHIWAKFRAGGRVVMAHASTDLAQMEREIGERVARELASRAPRGPGGAISGGWFKRKFRRLKNKIKAAAKKTGLTKIVKTVAKVAKKALDNPLVQAALASNPYGAAFLAARKAIQVGVKAVKGSLKARGVLKKMVNFAKGGNLKAKNFLRLVKQGVTGNPALFAKLAPKALKAAQTVTSGDAAELEQLAALVQGCTEPITTSAGYWEIAGEDSDGTTDQEIDFLETVASSGAFEGVRWLGSQLKLRSMDIPPELTARGALLLGRQAQGARFARA